MGKNFRKRRVRGKFFNEERTNLRNIWQTIFLFTPEKKKEKVFPLKEPSSQKEN